MFYNILTTLVCKPVMYLTLNLLTTTIAAPSSNVSKWKMGFNSVFKGLKSTALRRTELVG